MQIPNVPPTPHVTPSADKGGVDWAVILQIVGWIFIASLTVLYPYFKDRKDRQERARKEKQREIDTTVPNPPYDIVVVHDNYPLMDFTRIHNIIVRLFDSTVIERFLIIYGEGHFDTAYDENEPSSVSVHYEEHKGIPMTSEIDSFVGVGCDEHYHNMIQSLRYHRPYKLVTEDLQDGTMMKEMYVERTIVEGWAFLLDEYRVNHVERRVFCIFTTTHIDGIYTGFTKIRAAVDGIRAILKKSSDNIHSTMDTKIHMSEVDEDAA